MLLPPQESKEAAGGQHLLLASSQTLGAELRRVHRRFSGNLQLPPLSWRQAERDREREWGRPQTPEEEEGGGRAAGRPTSLPIPPPRIDITAADPDRWVGARLTAAPDLFVLVPMTPLLTGAQPPVPSAPP